MVDGLPGIITQVVQFIADFDNLNQPFPVSPLGRASRLFSSHPSSVAEKMPILPSLPKAFPMEDLIWALFRALPRRIGLRWVAEWQDRQEVQVRRNSQEFLDLVSL